MLMSLVTINMYMSVVLVYNGRDGKLETNDATFIKQTKKRVLFFHISDPDQTSLKY